MMRRIRLFCMALLAAAALTACTRADQGSLGTGTAAEGTASTAGGAALETASAQTEMAAPAPEDEDGTDVLAGLQDQAKAQGDQQTGEETSGQTEEATVIWQEEVTEAAAGEETETEAGQETETAVVEENYSDEEFEAMNETESGDWNGTFISAEGETLSITAVDDTHLSFAFANAGVSGEAELEGSQAVYYGDDYHVVVFDYVDGAVEVSVLSEEDYDASGSPLNGTYTR